MTLTCTIATRLQPCETQSGYDFAVGFSRRGCGLDGGLGRDAVARDEILAEMRRPGPSERFAFARVGTASPFREFTERSEVNVGRQTTAGSAPAGN